MSHLIFIEWSYAGPLEPFKPILNEIEMGQQQNASIKSQARTSITYIS